MNLLKTFFPFIFGKPVIPQLSMEEILNETVEYYSGNPKARRSSDNGVCSFNGPYGEHCAVGRCFLPEFQMLGDKLIGNRSNLITFMKLNGVESIDEFLQPQYRGKNYRFWTNLQYLHDTKENWNKNGLTEQGYLVVQRIRERIKTNFTNS